MTLAEQWKQEGYHKGLALAEQWKQEGLVLAEQREQEGAEKLHTAAINFLKLGVVDEKVAQATGIPLEKVRELQRKMYS